MYTVYVSKLVMKVNERDGGGKRHCLREEEGRDLPFTAPLLRFYVPLSTSQFKWSVVNWGSEHHNIVNFYSFSGPLWTSRKVTMLHAQEPYKVSAVTSLLGH